MPDLKGTVDLRYTEGMHAGLGYSFANPSALSLVVEPSSDTLKPIDEARGLITTYSCIIIDSIESLESHMASGIGASGRNMYGSASASLNQEQFALFNSHATFILARIQVRNPFIQYTGTARLTQRGLDLLHSGRSQAFKDAFGDGYIRGMATGGEYYAIISVLSNNELEQKKVSVHISGRLSGGAASANASLDSEMQSYLSTTRIEIRTYQSSGTGPQSAVIEPNFKSLGKRLRQFPSFVAANPVPIFMQIAPFSTLSNWPGNTALIDIDHQMEMLSHYKSIEYAYMTLQNDLMFAQNHGEYFLERPSVRNLNSWQRFVANKLDSVKQAFNSCSIRGICPTDIIYELPPGYEMPIRKDGNLSDEDSLLLGNIWKIRMEGSASDSFITLTRNLSTNTFTGKFYERGIESQVGRGIKATIYFNGEKNKLITITCNIAEFSIGDIKINGVAMDFQGFFKGLDAAYGCMVSNLTHIEPHEFDGTPRWTAEIIKTHSPLSSDIGILTSSSMSPRPSLSRAMPRALSLLDADFSGSTSSSSSGFIAAVPSSIPLDAISTASTSDSSSSSTLTRISISMFKNIFSPVSKKDEFLENFFKEFDAGTKEEALRYAVINDDLSSVLEVLRLKDLNLNYQELTSGKTILHEAYIKGNTEIIALLLAHGADETIMDKDQRLPKDYLSADSVLRLGAS